LSHLVELISQQRVQEIVNILLVLHIEGGSIVLAETELPDNGVEPCADLSDEIERILQSARAPM
jgi:hypothetical protein